MKTKSILITAIADYNGATINALGAAIGYTPEQVDDLFRESQRVEAGQ